jgi:hypothetical protein
LEYRHLGYVRAAEYMGLLQQRRSNLLREAKTSREATYHLGYLDAIKTMSEVQLRMVAQVIDAHPDHDREPGPFRKGQLCMMNKQGCYCLVIARESEGT